tara:strand:- start:3127 stop:5112 length:1986 start_codon:yes stop_codon:yes gene_type:complete
MIKNKIIIIMMVLVVLFIPWLNSDQENNFAIPKISQEDVSFFEINPCKISIVEFIKTNPESVYQNHYHFRADNRSSIECFGRVSGVTVLQKELQTQFFISIGTSSLINLLFQGSIWIILISLIPKNKKEANSNIKVKSYNITLLAISYLLTFSIYAQERFYEKNFYMVDLKEQSSYLLIFLIFIFIINNFITAFLSRSKNVLNYLPYIFIFTGIFSGFNLNIFSIIFLYFGFQSFFLGQGSKVFNYIYGALSLWWLFNSRGSFSFPVGKLRGFTSSTFEFNANLFWILFLFFTVKGLWYFYQLSKASFNLELFVKNLSITAFGLLSIGTLCANFPIFNFISYYFLGLQRYGIESNTPFAFDEYLVKISWRGIFPSAETIGEFYGLCLIFILFLVFKKNQISFYEYLGIFSSALGLYFSDNRTSIILVFLIVLFFGIRKLNIKVTIKTKKIIISLFLFLSLGLLLLLMSKDNSRINFMAQSVLSNANFYQFDSIFSSSLTYLNEMKDKSIISIFFGLISFIAYLLNRSELWGIFFARYNPTFNESLFGSGPLNFGQLYGETVISYTDSFLLPHSSMLSYLVFFGQIPLLILSIMSIYYLIKNRHNHEFVAIFLYLFINIVKNDSLNYYSSFVFYFLILLVMLNKDILQNYLNPSFNKNKYAT